jgi:LysM repeat protein/ABC-type branched-subunit amino acid transport system substrate-binding protein
MKRFLILIFILGSFFTSGLYAQEVKISDKIEKQNGKEYYLHTVQKGESVWKIAKAYSVTSEDIFSSNPDAKKEIKPGQVLKVIVKNKKVEYQNHTVEKGESLYKIAKKYNVSIESITNANPDLGEKIKPGQILKIPLNPDSTISQTLKVNVSDTVKSGDNKIEKCDCKKPKLLESYNIALMVPFYLSQMYQINLDDPDIEEKDQDDFASFTFIQFYEGVLMALDSLKKSGFSAKVFVYDVDEDSSKTAALLEKPELAKMNLIIGPFFKSSLAPVVAFAKKHKIRVVDPVSSDEEILKENPFVFKATPSVSTQFNDVAEYFVNAYPTATIIISHNNKENEIKYLTSLKEALNLQLKKAGRPENSFKEAVISTVGVGGVTKLFNPSDTNIVITLTSGEVFVSNFVRNLSDVYDSYKMIVVGLPGWKNYENIEAEYFQNINLHLFASSFVDYSRDDVKDFILKYRSKYKTEPNKYAFQGFDIGMFFFKALKTYGPSFEGCIDNLSGTYLQSKYDFKTSGGGNGYENKELNIYRYFDFNLVDARASKKLGLTQKEKK